MVWILLTWLVGDFVAGFMAALFGITLITPPIDFNRYAHDPEVFGEMFANFLIFMWLKIVLSLFYLIFDIICLASHGCTFPMFCMGLRFIGRDTQKV